MDVIAAENLTKHFRLLNRHEGITGAFRDLFSTDYKTVKAVDGISMHISRGEVVGYIGPNGAGKSTTIKMMTGILTPTSGTLKINGLIPHTNRKKNAQNMGVVFGQRTQLWWDLPVIESFNILKEIYRVDTATYQKNLDMFNALVDLQALYRSPVRTLSLGQRMLCDIAAAFLHSPPIVFLDEPTIGLDVSVKNKFRSLIHALNTEYQTTIILTTHDIGDIEALCERVIIIDKGRVIFDDKTEKVNRLFGAYRTLSLQIHPPAPSFTEAFTANLRASFPVIDTVTFDDTDHWFHLNINQDQVALKDVLNFAMTEYRVSDVKITEITTENVIRQIYEGTAS
ncbi:MAG: ATP-binding cassette domain-containing protein [Anaerolineae bacterium]|nr:ATP-binding cassette domain-containing protein [Anaerolineae bacterium]